MESFVYLLCAVAAIACSALLLRGYLRRRTRLLLWCGLFFVTLGFENIMLFMDFVAVPDTDLSFIRRGVPLAGVLMLLYGLIWDVR